MRRVLIYLSFALCLISCDYPIFVHYTVQNASKETVTMRYAYQTGEFDRTLSDTTLSILPGATDTLFTFRSISSSVYLPEQSDTLKYLKKVELDGKLSDLPSGILLKKNWKFIKTKRNVARLEFQIN